MAYSEAAMLANIIFSSIFAFFGTFGNILVIVAFFSVRSLRTINNIFVVQLAFVDLTKASFTLTIKSVNQARGATSMVEGFCEVTGMLRAIGSCQSAVLLATIAVVRFFKVVRPRSFDKIFTLKKTLVYCGMICGGTFILSLLPVVGLGKYTFSKSHGACFVTWAKINIAFRSIYYFFNVGLTFPVLIFCYYNIFKRLREHSRAITPRINRKGRSTALPPKIQVTKPVDGARNGENETNDYSAVGNVDVEIEKKNDVNNGGEMKSAGPKNHLKVDGAKNGKTKGEKRRVRIKNAKAWFRMKREKSEVELEVTKVMFAIVVAYTVCWIPAAFVNFLNLSKVVAIPGDVLLLIVTLVDLKVCLNPLIYGIGSKQFRNAFLQVLLRRKGEQDTMSGAGNSKFASTDEGSKSDDYSQDVDENQKATYV